MIKAAIFDMDGLIIDSEPFWRQSHREAMAAHDVIISEDEVRAMAGRRTDEVVREWHRLFGLQNITPEDLQAEIEGGVIEHIKLNGQALPGVQKAFEILAEHEIPCAVASSSTPPIIEAVLDKLGFTQYIKFAYSAVYEEFGKPHPGVFLTTAKRLGVLAADCLVFEDSLNGVRAAKAADMKCIAVPEAVNLHKPEYAEANLVVDSLEAVNWQTIANLFSDEQ